MDIKGLIVGLGNPGPEYQQTRHNIGFMVIDSILDEIENKPYRRIQEIKSPDEFKLWSVSLPRIKGNFLLAQPQTYMNLSGIAVARVCKDFGVSPKNLLVVHDEMDIALGKIKLKFGGGIAGHNGLKSIVQELGTDKFFRMRVGIGRPEKSWEVKDYVLSPFTSDEWEIVPKVLTKAREGLPLLFGKGLGMAQQTLHPFDATQELTQK